MDDLLVEKVLRAVECIPAGEVASYGMIAELVGTGPRQVGRIMSTWGSNVPWWRVTNAAGALPADLAARAIPEWIAEATPRTATGTAVAMRRARTDASALAHAWQLSCRDLPAS